MKYAQPIAIAWETVVLVEFVVLNSLLITALFCPVNTSIMVYIALTNIIGLTMGKVIFQKDSHLVAPSTSEASKRAGDIVCKAARNINICTPEILIILLNSPKALVIKLAKPPSPSISLSVFSSMPTISSPISAVEELVPLDI